MENKNLTGYPSVDKPWLKYYSKEAINAPLPECTIYEYLWENNKDHLDDVALNYFDRKITFRELFDNTEKAAKSFSAIGLKQGDIIVMATVTTPETVYSFYGLNRLGVIANMVDPRTSVEGIKDYITEVNAKIVLTIDAAYPKIEKAIEQTEVKKVIVVSPADSLTQPKKLLFNISKRLKGTKSHLKANCLTWDKFMAGSETAHPQYVSYQKDTCCVIVHTGGTTGTPKGVMLSNDNLNALVFQSILTGIDMKREHSWLDIMPPFIAYGIGMGIHLPLIIGMETILIPSFNPNHFDDLLIKFKPIHMVGVPSHWGTIMESKKLKNKNLSYIIAPTVGGDTMNKELEIEANKWLRSHGCVSKITKGYGMTEVCAGVSGTVDDNNELGSAGIPFVKTVISVFDFKTEKELSYNQIGEICIASPNVMLGYYNNTEATNNVIRTHNDGTKWLHTGDMGYIKENGALFISGRVKRMIIRHDGFKVFPSFIEEVILKNGKVDMCCVVGAVDKEHSQGMLPIVYVVLKSSTLNESFVKQDLSALCQKELPEYAQPVDYKFIKSLPLTPIGKVDYLALEKMAEEKVNGK